MMNKKFVGLILLALMFLSPFAFASSVRLVRVSDLGVGDVVIDPVGQGPNGAGEWDGVEILARTPSAVEIRTEALLSVERFAVEEEGDVIVDDRVDSERANVVNGWLRNGYGYMKINLLRRGQSFKYL